MTPNLPYLIASFGFVFRFTVQLDGQSLRCTLRHPCELARASMKRGLL